MTLDESIQEFADELAARNVILDGAVLMPPQDPPTSDNAAEQREVARDPFGPLALLKVAIGAMRPDPANGRRCKIVIVSGISSAQVLGNYASSNVIRCAWLAESKTLAFAFGERGIHVNTLSLGGTLTPGYAASLGKRVANAGMSYEECLDEETSNVPLRKYGTTAEVASAVEGLLSAFSDHMSGLNVLHDGGFTRAYRALLGLAALPRRSPLSDGLFGSAGDSCGSAAPAPDFRMQLFSHYLVPVVGRFARMTALAEICFHEEFRERLLPRWSCPSIRKSKSVSFGSIPESRDLRMQPFTRVLGTVLRCDRRNEHCRRTRFLQTGSANVKLC